MVNADDVLAYLDAEGVSIPRDRVRDYLIEITSSEAFLHPAAELAITTALLHAYVTGDRGRPDRTETFMEDLARIAMFPHVLFLGVMTRDWPGLADCVAGIVHEKGWNIAFLKGVTLSFKKEDLGVILIGIKVEDEMGLQVLGEERGTFLKDLANVACGSKAKTYLLTRQARKLEIYSQVIGHVPQVYHGDDVDRILGEDGEAVKFFASRSNAYVLERSVEDLSRQIINNYLFVKRVRASGGLLQLDVNNIVTTRERLTGITVCGFEREISPSLVLDAIKKAWPGFQRKFHKEFTTSDGITLYRIEGCDVEGASADEETLTRLRKILEKVSTTKRVERARYIESIGGFEHYARAIIPFLVKEHDATGIPQVFIAAGQANEFLQEFKLIMVLPEKLGKADPLPRFFEAIEEVSGLGIVSTHPPKIMGKQRVEMLDVSADLGSFGEAEQIYALLKSRIRDIVGDFRDFDEGMRRADRSNLERVQSLLPQIDEPVLREFYYHLDDFYRVGAPVEELSALISLAVKAMKASHDGDGTLEVLSGTASVDIGDGQSFPTATLLAIAYSIHKSYLRCVLECLSGLDCTMSKLAHENTTVLTIRAMKDHRPLPEGALAERVECIKRLAAVPDGTTVP